MNPAELITGRSLIVIGMLVVAFVFVLRRTILRAGSTRGRASSSSAGKDFESTEAGAQGLTEMLEVRLHDFAREVEGRMLTRIAVLDRLIVDADREILRLQDLLAATKGENVATSRPSQTTDERPSDGPFAGAGSSRQPDAVLSLPATGVDDQKEAA